MAAATITPILDTMTTTEADLTTGPASAAVEWLVDVRVTNVTAAAVLVRLALSNGTTTKYLAYDYSLGPYASIDLARGLALPYGWKLRDRASAGSAVDVLVTGTQRAA